MKLTRKTLDALNFYANLSNYKSIYMSNYNIIRHNMINAISAKIAELLLKLNKKCNQ